MKFGINILHSAFKFNLLPISCINIKRSAMKHVFIFLLLTLPLIASAQNFEYAKITADDLNVDRKKLDSNANAMVIKEFGTAAIGIDDDRGRLYIDFQYHVRIKIFNKNGFNQGNIVIPLRIYNSDQDEISELKATTINFIDGEFMMTELENKKVFSERKNKYVTLTKFTMPNLQEGSIIEYSYRLRSPYIFNFRSWEFQSDIPKLHSEYIAVIPGLYNYNVSLRGAQKLTSQNAELSRDCIRIAGRAFDCSKMTYIMDNIPAFVEEEYMTAASNFKSAINFELSDYIMITGARKSLTKEWKDVDYELLSDKSFGSQMKKKDVFKDLLPGIIKTETEPLAKAMAMYSYIQKNIKLNGFYGMYSEQGVKQALETHSGNIGDINLALIAGLSAAGLDAEAVILSTRSNGIVNSLFPVISDFNYVVAKVNIGDKSYLLDASDPLNPFGLLPLTCINGQGRVIQAKKPSYWLPLTASQRQVTRYTLNGEFTSDGKIKGDLITYTLGYPAYNKRKKIIAAGSVDEYVEKLDEQMNKISILKHEITNLDSLDKSLVENFQVEFSSHPPFTSSQVFFNPFIIERINKNPFNLNERSYPVDLAAASEVRVTMSLTIPENYALADQPKDVSLGLPNNGGRYVCNITLENNILTFNQLLQFNKPVYSSEEYLYLKEFYSRIIQSQKTDIVFKKIK
jgi:hypothetical protein